MELEFNASINSFTLLDTNERFLFKQNKLIEMLLSLLFSSTLQFSFKYLQIVLLKNFFEINFSFSSIISVKIILSLLSNVTILILFKYINIERLNSLHLLFFYFFIYFIAIESIICVYIMTKKFNNFFII